MAHRESGKAKTAPGPVRDPFPKGNIKGLEVSRVICGGNLISGFAHSRDLIYVSSLLKQYFTDEKVFETLARCEDRGINTAILRLDQHTLRIINNYWKNEGGKMQWICQCKIQTMDIVSGIQPAIDNGAHACYIHGGVADQMVANGRMDVLAKAVEYIKDQGLPAGIAGHMVEVPKAVLEAGLDVDFFMKTLNAKNYWSAGHEPRHDSVWSETPEETAEVMAKAEKPWIAYKVLGAGAIHPREGFRYAYEKGADFLCVGMFDFQIDEDAEIAKKMLEEGIDRERPWRA